MFKRIPYDRQKPERTRPPATSAGEMPAAHLHERERE